MNIRRVPRKRVMPPGSKVASERGLRASVRGLFVVLDAIGVDNA